MLTLTKHCKDRAKERGISFSILLKASNLDRKYCHKIFPSGKSVVKRIFYPINLKFALRDGYINKFEFSKLKNLCLVINIEDNNLITIYQLNPLRYLNRGLN